MKNRFLVLALLGLLGFFVFAITGLALAQQFKPIKPQTQIKPIKPQTLGKTYWCAKVEDILIKPEKFSTADNISVGVRIRFTKQTYIPGAPGQKLCNCAFEGPSGELAKVWTKTISLRLIGIKYSERETNVLEYYGPTPVFPIHTFSGFQVIGVTITEGDLKEGVKVVWGWVPKKNPLNDNREFKIYVTLDVNGYTLQGNDDPDYLTKTCFPPSGYPGDFEKSFTPRRLEVPKIDLEKQKESIKHAEESIKRTMLPDLKITKCLIFPRISKKANEHGIMYDEAAIRVDIVNSGKSDVSKFKVKVERKWEWENDYRPEGGQNSRYEVGYYYGKDQKWNRIKSGKILNGIIEIEGLQANGGYRTIWIYVDNSWSPKADCWFRIILDPDNEVAELDESNNGISNTLFPSSYKHPEKYKSSEQKTPELLPDLTVQSISINKKEKYKDEYGISRIRYTVAIVIANKGNVDASNFEIRTEGLGITSSGSWYTIDKKEDYKLTAGNFAIITNSISVADLEGRKSLYRVIIYSKGRVPELNEDNNIKEFEVEGYSGPITIIKDK